MLEHRELLLCPADAQDVRTIRVPASGAALGSVRLSVRRVWWWPAGTRWSIHEADDEPLLFTMRRRWGWPARWDVSDADGFFVGDVLGPVVRGETGRRLATRVRLAGGLTALVSPHGPVLAELWPGGDGLRLTFAAEVEPEPFVKMLLLAAVLANS